MLEIIWVYAIGKRSWSRRQNETSRDNSYSSKLSPLEKLKLIRILAEDLDTVKDISPLEPLKTYDLPTPYNSFGAGAVLMEALEQKDSSD
jgi:hypothetical protein